ncbi:MAG TPA: non-homologous end-joining DNA ligase [Actinophytocola sp.]|uniref:non-homologous end-joining DNA ligase n=1 Tax=Actinophytocola sp. TaxID=1872138 RepID=UPI002DDD54A6|nr:non-homologous end-joining DNA ligase [Actinophytocola sp.]HEV2783771.1 non-homologous end-joining DNA ligase [Actinophytocola sp.]
MSPADLPEPVLPMMATAGSAPSGPGARDFGFEFKWDGVRAVTAVGGGAVRAISRNNNDVTRSYPELRALAELTGRRRVVVDGEIVALDDTGRARFDLLQLRMHIHAPTATLLGQVPITYVLFDLLHLDGTSLLEQPYRRRRELLDELDLDGRSPRVRVPDYHVDVDGPQLLEVARAHHLEGVVAKRLASRYEPGRRSRAWIKTALLNTQEVVIGGWHAGEGRRTGTLGSLLLGIHDRRGRLVFVGKVGTGFTDAMLRDLHSRLAPLHRNDSPFDTPVPREDARFAHWVEPRIVGEVEYRQLTHDRRLRHAAWRGLRNDKTPDQVTLPFLG